MGCLIKRLSYSPKMNILSNTKAVTSTNIGSVGKLSPVPPVRSVRFTEIGVAATINHMAQSNRYKVTQKTINPPGINSSGHHSLATISATNGSSKTAISAVILFGMCPKEVTMPWHVIQEQYL